MKRHGKHSHLKLRENNYYFTTTAETEYDC
jgi:hypothetical protein